MDDLIEARALLKTAKADAEQGDENSRSAWRHTDPPAAGTMFATLSMASYLSSIARSLLLVATMVVEDMADEAGITLSDSPPVPPADREVE